MGDAPTAEERARAMMGQIPYRGPYGGLVIIEGVIAAAIREAEARGAERMRERAAKVAGMYGADTRMALNFPASLKPYVVDAALEIVRRINALPLGEESCLTS